MIAARRFPGIPSLVVRYSIAIIVVILLGISATASAAQSQTESQSSGRGLAREDLRPVRVALVDALGEADARAMIVRRGARRTLDLVVVTPETTPEDLSRAIGILLRSRRFQETRGNGEMRTFVAAAPAGTPRNADLAFRVLEALGSAQAILVRDFGVVPSIVTRGARR